MHCNGESSKHNTKEGDANVRVKNNFKKSSFLGICSSFVNKVSLILLLGGRIGKGSATMKGVNLFGVAIAVTMATITVQTGVAKKSQGTNIQTTKGKTGPKSPEKGSNAPKTPGEVLNVPEFVEDLDRVAELPMEKQIEILRQNIKETKEGINGGI